jgi:hypothetical protein
MVSLIFTEVFMKLIGCKYMQLFGFENSFFFLFKNDLPAPSDALPTGSQKMINLQALHVDPAHNLPRVLERQY